MQVRTVMAKDVHSVASSTGLAEAARLMDEAGVGFLPVTKDGALAGVVTDRDLAVRGLAGIKDPTKLTVGEVMSVEVVCCFDDQRTDEAKQLMEEYQVRRLPVMRHDHKLVGIVSRSNIDGTGTQGKAPIRVTFHKEKTDAYGRPHKVPLRTLYITGVKGKEEAEDKAVKRLEGEERTVWRNVADSYEVDDTAARTPERPR